MTLPTLPLIPTGLPPLDAASAQHAEKVARYLAQQVEACPAGFMPFEQWMHLALYAPGLGYYAAGNTKFGADLPTGDFTTAPEMTPLFGQTLARQIAQALTACGSVQVLEFGAGSGALASALIPALRQLGMDPVYQILEVSADLRARQQQRLAPFGASVTWLDALPEAFSGCVIANEVLDAMPATLFSWSNDGQVMEIGVRLLEGTTSSAAPAFSYAQRPASVALHSIVAQRMPPLPGYQSEINLQAEAWVRQMGGWLKQGLALLIDYGFPQHEYYHPQRNEGTLMCHFRHHAHSQPLIYAGLQDITAHVDFTAMADAALDGGLEVRGYTSQARFLMNAGLPELLLDADASTRPEIMSAVQKLVSEAEMGELFKVLAIGKGIDEPLIGYTRGDRRDRL
ncbi:SAM-dependent methyltransferase [Alcaligenaceae bacterium]|nr:SAM-dependent methyltransferase [Alcaligenaceae bacterium]